MTVIDMDDFRKKTSFTEGSYDGLTCRYCASAWFCLGGDPAVVCVGPNGEITGYAGYLYCAECGRPSG